MAKGNLFLGMARKKIGDVVFYRANGEQISRARNRAPRNPRSEKQSVQRMVLATAAKTRAALAGLYNHSFEGVEVGVKSLQHAQRILMEGYRGYAAAFFNSASISETRYVYAIKGAPIAGIYQGMPLSRGRLAMNAYSITSEPSEAAGAIVNLSVSSAFTDGTISTQAAYAAELAGMGLEPGDQLTVVGYFQNYENIVASFESPYGLAENEADMFRYARVTFVPELPENFSGKLIVNGAFNPALIAKSEGTMPGVVFDESLTGNSLIFNFAPVLPLGYKAFGVAVVRSQMAANGRTYYSPANFECTTGVGSGNLWRIMSSYMDNATGIDVGDTLYLKNAEAAALGN